MKAYAIAHLRNVKMGAAIADYLERIDATLQPWGGRFLVHGGHLDVIEGAFDGDLVIIEFPGIDAARGWYRSDSYQAILSRRTDNADCCAFLVEGVPADYKATDVLTS